MTHTPHEAETRNPIDLEALSRRVFLTAHSDGWTGNQCRRDVQHVDAEKSWSLYVTNGALGKSIAAASQAEPIDDISYAGAEVDWSEPRAVGEDVVERGRVLRARQLLAAEAINDETRGAILRGEGVMIWSMDALAAVPPFPDPAAVEDRWIDISASQFAAIQRDALERAAQATECLACANAIRLLSPIQGEE